MPSQIAAQANALIPTPNKPLLDVLRCPICKGILSLRPQELICPHCQRTYPIVLGIPDLRVYGDPLIPSQDDFRKGEKIQAEAERLGFADLVRYYWSLPTYPPTPPDLSERFIRHVLTDEQRIEGYKDKLGHGASFLDVGCGTAALVKVAQQSFGFAVGCDIAFRWLLIARTRLLEAGLQPNLVCCCADFLPFPDRYFDSVASVSLLEHVSEAGAAIREMGRVTKRDSSIFVWTANRFSLAPEPHVRVWGVGFMPRRWMPAYIKWRRGMAYEKKHLLSCFELRKLLKQAGLNSVRFSLPVVTPADWANLKGVERVGARIYVWLANFLLFRWLLIMVSPAILAVARRGSPSSAWSRSKY
jgi:ubiquinone/menaquinone biosynthesis C-methylase UbiE